jgi:hypothetical protein
MTDHDFLSDTFAQIAARLGAVSAERHPLPTDRWIARSALQKAVRRGEAETAERAVLTLAEYEPRSAWRALTIIAMEDVGVGGFDAVCETISLARSTTTRRGLGGDRILLRYAARRLAQAAHCQAVCDLLMRAQHDPAWESYRADIADAGPSGQLAVLREPEAPIIARSIALLTFLAGDNGPVRGRAEAILAASAGDGLLGQVAGIGWTISRNEMALLMPLVVQAWSAGPGDNALADDPTPPVTLIGEVPAYALDQFTRTGKAAIRRWIWRDRALRSILARAKVPDAHWPQLVSDAVFLVEGSCCRNRYIWETGDSLRLPARPLPGAFGLGDYLEDVTRRVRGSLPELDAIRAQLSPPIPTAPPAALNRHDAPKADQQPHPHSADRQGRFVWGSDQVTFIPPAPPPSELGLVPISVALEKVARLKPGSSPSTVASPHPVYEMPVLAGGLDLSTYLLVNVSLQALRHVRVELDREELVAIIERRRPFSIPRVFEHGDELVIYDAPEQVLARELLGDREIVVAVLRQRMD